MSTSRVVLAAAFFILGVAIAVPAAGQGPPTCPPEWPNPCCAISSWGGTPYASITGALYTNTPTVITNGTVWVYGVCTEGEVVINERFNNVGLIGNATGTPATLQGVTPGGNAITIFGKRITVRGFTIIPASATGAQYGVEVMRGGNAVIDRCTIDGFAGEGIGVVQQAFARIVNNTLQNNGGEGILAHETSMVRIGFLSVGDAAPQPNTIRNNALAGIRVDRTSDARITGNAITNNGEAGIAVENNSHADIAWNQISGNQGAGIRVHLNSSARLGTGSGRADWNVPNSTATPNAGVGMECTLGGAVEGTLGTLTGVEGRQKFGQGCMHDFTP